MSVVRKLLGMALIATVLVILPGGLAGAAVSSDWPSLNYDAAQTNANTGEKSLTPGNVLALKVRWVQGVPDVSYPVIAAGRVYVPALSKNHVYVQALDGRTGKRSAFYSRGALGGLLVRDGKLYAAGPSLRQIDLSSGQDGDEVKASPQVPGAVFSNPAADSKVLVAGYAGKYANTLYGLDPTSGHSYWKLPSLTGEGAVGIGRIITDTSNGTVFYDESTGKRAATLSHLHGSWFAGKSLAYTVFSPSRQSGTLYAVNKFGKQAWKRVIAPPIAAGDWPHAVTSDRVFVEILKPWVGVQALDAAKGNVVWKRRIPDVQKIAFANGMVFVLTYGLGQPARVVILKAGSGSYIGAIVLSNGYFAFPANNGLMVANGMVFIHTNGPSGPQMVALGR